MPYLKRNRIPFLLLGFLFLSVATFLVSLSFRQYSPKTLAQENIPQIQPKVLGAFTNVRGDSSNTVLNFIKAKEINQNIITAKSFLAYDLETSQVLAEKSSTTKISIASITKLVTALVSYEKLNLNSSVTISASDILNISPKLNLWIGDTVKVGDLLNSMLVGSDNDAAQTLADFTTTTTGEGFVGLMNKKAQDLKMQNSQFSNPLGFDSQHNFSTAQDLEKLVNETQKIALFVNLGRSSNYSFQNEVGKRYFTVATNKLPEKYPDLEAVKTGFTEGAQGAMITKLSFAGHKIILIVLGSQNREEDTLRLRQEILDSFVLGK